MYYVICRFKVFTLALLGFLFLHSFVLANDAGSIIEGVVLNENDEPLAGANIMLTSLEMGASTNQNGRFTISQ
ncbi:MAG: hypothetical protein GF372_02295, partial [Candidatus Marinimicrobia bacterium]|nr:hypothetical protein [Candidatus Neomarinimicrobiota bacterium]